MEYERGQSLVLWHGRSKGSFTLRTPLLTLMFVITPFSLHSQVQRETLDILVDGFLGSTYKFTPSCHFGSHLAYFSLFLRMMLIQSLIKIPCILVAMVGIHTATTPPQPPPSVNETAPSTKLEVLIKPRWGPVIVKVYNFTPILYPMIVRYLFLHRRRYAGQLRWPKSQPFLQL